MVLLGYYGNFAYVWNFNERMQLYRIDTKGGNRPIRFKIQDGNLKDYGKHFILAYSYGDCLVISSKWSMNDTSINEEVD